MANVNVVVIKPMYHPTMGALSVGQQGLMPEEDVDRYKSAGLVVEAGESVSSPAIGADSTVEQLKAAWDLDMSPGEYLDKFPNGEHSDLALRIVELEHAAAETATK